VVATIARVILLAIMVGAVLQAVAILVHFVVRPAALDPWPHAYAYGAFVCCVASIVLMLAMALNSSLLRDRVFDPSRLGTLYVVVWASGAVAIIVGLVGGFGLGAYVAIELLLGAVPFVLMGLVSPGLYRRPAAERSASGRHAGGDENPGPASSSRERARQRRGGRARR
jgi:hypothetical protein